MNLNIGTLAWIVEWSLIPMEEYILVKIRKLRGREEGHLFSFRPISYINHLKWMFFLKNRSLPEGRHP